MQHAWKREVIRINRRAGDFIRAVRALVRAAHNRPRAFRNGLDRPFHRLPGLDRFARRLDRLDDGAVSAAAAEGVFERVTDFTLADRRIFLQQRISGHDLPGDTETTLHRPVLDKGLLQRVEHFFVRPAAGRCQPFDRGHLSSGCFGSRVIAGQDGFAIHQDRTRAAFRLVAADFRPGQFEAIAQHIGEHLSWEDWQMHFLTIYR